MPNFPNVPRYDTPDFWFAVAILASVALVLLLFAAVVLQRFFGTARSRVVTVREPVPGDRGVFHEEREPMGWLGCLGVIFMVIHSIVIVGSLIVALLIRFGWLTLPPPS